MPIYYIIISVHISSLSLARNFLSSLSKRVRQWINHSSVGWPLHLSVSCLFSILIFFLLFCPLWPSHCGECRRFTCEHISKQNNNSFWCLHRTKQRCNCDIWYVLLRSLLKFTKRCNCAVFVSFHSLLSRLHWLLSLFGTFERHPKHWRRVKKEEKKPTQLLMHSILVYVHFSRRAIIAYTHR